MNVEYIPPKPHYDITFQALEFYVAQIPDGQVITEKKLMTYLKKLYGDDRLAVDEDSIPLSVFRDPDIPFWRYLSTTGLVVADHFFISEETYAKKLAEEGHLILQNQHGRFKVEDYKETMADPTLFRVLQADKALVRVGDMNRTTKSHLANVVLFDDNGHETVAYRIENGKRIDVF